MGPTHAERVADALWALVGIAIVIVVGAGVSIALSSAVESSPQGRVVDEACMCLCPTSESI